jgi:TPP-dependent indolepyruvate ferredoxin oxidoreductase alpha subunit
MAPRIKRCTFQKMTATAANAAGVAVIKGFEGQPVSAIKRLEFYWRTDGHCGAGAPRFDVFYQPALGPQQTLFIGCQGG